MKIFSDIVKGQDHRNKTVPIFVLYLDTQSTGDPDKDIKHCAQDITGLKMDAESINGLLIPMISSLIEESYGGQESKETLTDWHTTGFDRNYPNGVKV